MKSRQLIGHGTLGVMLSAILLAANAGAALGAVSAGNKVGNKCWNSSSGAMAFANYAGFQFSSGQSTYTSWSCVAYSLVGPQEITYQLGSYDRSRDSRSSVNQTYFQIHDSNGWRSVNGLFEVRNAGGAGTTQVGGSWFTKFRYASDYYRFKMRACVADGGGRADNCSGWLYTSARAW